MAPHSSTLGWKIPWMEEPGRLQSMGSLRVGHDLSDLAAAFLHYLQVCLYCSECEVKRSLGSITKNKASEDNGIPVKLFQILKDDAMKVLHSTCQQIGKTQQWSQFSFQSQREAMTKNVQTTAQLHSSHMLAE